MPTYEYECQSCNHKFEKFQSMSDEPVKECEKCGKEVKKLFGTAGIIFKGSGFYVNDYKKDNSKKAPQPAGNCNSCSSANTCPSAE